MNFPVTASPRATCPPVALRYRWARRPKAHINEKAYRRAPLPTLQQPYHYPTAEKITRTDQAHLD